MCASAFGGTKGQLVRPAWSRLPGAWKNSLVPVEAAIGQMVFTRCGIPRSVAVAGRMPSPDHVLEVESFSGIDELVRLRKFSQDLGSAGTSQHLRRFEAVCASLKLPIEQAKGVLEYLTKGLEALAVGASSGEVKVAEDILVNFLSLTLGLLQSEVWTDQYLRRWMGKAIFLSTIYRPLLSVLETVLPRMIEMEPQGFVPTSNVIEEVICFTVFRFRLSRYGGSECQRKSR